ncbi:MAG: deoxyribodipyrimidine photo-lyase [Puniceicoccaceae bacterium]|nr:MAG: deoxyribodipyrimidine photo-lyase [Puniceicoccaceae bacterium]
MPAEPVIVWFRQDLRLTDNPALNWACSLDRPLLPVFIWSPEEETPWAPGGAARWWLYRSLGQLVDALAEKGLPLILRQGPAGRELDALIGKTGAAAVSWNRRYEPAIIKRDAAIKSALLDRGLEVRSFNGSLLFSPPEIASKSGGPFKVFTPFWKHCLSLSAREPERTATLGVPAGKKPASLPLADLGLLPEIRWDRKFEDHWQPGEAGARRALRRFLDHALRNYGAGRNRPDQDNTSRLSPHLHWGEISPAQVRSAVVSAGEGRGAETFLSEIGWREFAHHLLFHFPDTPEEPLRPEFGAFPWKPNARALQSWQRGTTGYPIVDAGMRQLWETGWMHNRVRMIVASFLVKHLLQPWQEGAAWFWDTLLDADLASNTLGWQWSAGCGADAAPYFRVFNPILQGKKFDPDGVYVRRWVPELGKLGTVWIHEPWAASTTELTSAGLRLGETYPAPIVDHQAGRKRALAAYQGLKKQS